MFEEGGFSGKIFSGGIFLGFFSGWYFSVVLIFSGYDRGNTLMVHLLEYLPLSPSFNVGLGLLTGGAGTKLNPFSIEVRGKMGGG